ncbi:6-phosphogluconolactonase [Paraburkholderia eburnea]|uniref:6-phosphogluconolactonase n=1 Tax=Paraburkholderia eburnea TaxID=1189126 RepID=A0A2S4M0D8_9BURK|nr:6-phosphogluconolactonase [Paraburkholderia eburnea]POR48196.1 6-phosphogluconolactonase [Paraburkholderia eburnea]PRZ22221.1 6-phosphogluconolactonase [Paraburkholderia eburnea]
MIELHVFDDPRVQSDALARAVGDALHASLTALAAAPGTGARRATLAVSGGTSPRPFLENLSTHRFDWAHTDVTLVDDRWVSESDAASNARLVRETLLKHEAANARFLPLVDVAQDLDAHVAALNADAQRRVPNVAVLGMGEDGHTASIFADAPEWADAITTARPFVAVHPQAAPHARVSWSMQALRQVDRLFLLIAGQRKLDVLQQAAATEQNNAISKLANDKGVRLDVYWCA